jgi:hypothetical protein
MLNEGRHCDAVMIGFARHGADRRGIMQDWQCGMCRTDRNRPIDTMLPVTTRSCDYCLAENMFDFRKPS